MIDYLKRTNEISILDTIVIGVISAVIGSILVLLIVKLSERILAAITRAIKVVFKTPIEKLSYRYRIVRRKAKLNDLIRIEAKFAELTATKLELRAYKKFNKKFTTMQEHNEKNEAIKKLRSEDNPFGMF